MTPPELLRIRAERGDERRAAWLIVFVVLAAALATGLLEDREGAGADDVATVGR